MDVSNKKLVAGILGIVFGAFGIHKFFLGYTTAGIIMLLVTVLSLGFASWAIGVIGVVEGIIYLTKSDSEFYNTYVLGKREWL